MAEEQPEVEIVEYWRPIPGSNCEDFVRETWRLITRVVGGKTITAYYLESTVVVDTRCPFVEPE